MEKQLNYVDGHHDQGLINSNNTETKASSIFTGQSFGKC